MESNVILEIQDTVALGDISRALALMHEVVPKDYLNEVNILLSRNNRMKKQLRLGLISTQDSEVISNNISFSILELCKEITKKVFNKKENKIIKKFRDYETWNDNNCFQIIEKNIEIDLTVCHDDQDGSSTIIEFTEQKFMRRNESQDFYVVSASSSNKYPTFDTTPSPSKILKLDTIEDIPGNNIMYKSIGFYDMSHVEVGEITSIANRNYLPREVCQENLKNFIIGSKYNCEKYRIQIDYSLIYNPKITCYKIPKKIFSGQASGVSIKKYLLPVPDIMVENFDNYTSLVWIIINPDEKYFYSISLQS